MTGESSKFSRGGMYASALKYRVDCERAPTLAGNRTFVKNIPIIDENTTGIDLRRRHLGERLFGVGRSIVPALVKVL